MENKALLVKEDNILFKQDKCDTHELLDPSSDEASPRSQKSQRNQRNQRNQKSQGSCKRSDDTSPKNSKVSWKGKGSLLKDLNEESRSRRQSQKDSNHNSRQNRRKSQKIDIAPVAQADRGSESSSPELGELGWWDGTKVEDNTAGTLLNQRSDSPGGRRLAANTHTLRKKGGSGDSAAEPPVKAARDEKDEHVSLILELRENAMR